MQRTIGYHSQSTKSNQNKRIAFEKCNNRRKHTFYEWLIYLLNFQRLYLNINCMFGRRQFAKKENDYSWVVVCVSVDVDIWVLLSQCICVRISITTLKQQMPKLTKWHKAEWEMEGWILLRTAWTSLFFALAFSRLRLAASYAARQRKRRTSNAFAALLSRW